MFVNPLYALILVVILARKIVDLIGKFLRKYVLM
jgi:hypothetical protein